MSGVAGQGAVEEPGVADPPCDVLAWISEGTFQWTPGEATLTLDDRLARALGLEASRLQREDWIGRVHAEDCADYAQGFDGTAFRGSGSFRYRLEFPGRGWRWVRERARLVEGTEGARVLAVIQDVDDEIREMQGRLALFERTPTMLHATAPDGTLLAVSDEWCRRLGYEPEEVVGGPSIFILTAESAYRAVNEEIPRVWREGRISEVPMKVQSREGEIIDVLLSAVAERDASGAPLRSLVVMQDVTESRRMQEDLRANERRLELAMSAATIGAWDWDIATGSLTWDANMMSIFGITAEEFSGDYQGFSERVHPEDLERVSREVLESLENDQGQFDSTFRIIHPDGTLRHIVGRGQVHRVDGVVPKRMIGVNVDVTALKEAEAAARARAAELQVSNQELEAFVRIASHDLQEPLRKISGFCELLRKSYGGSLGEDADRWIDYAVSGARRMKELISALLAHSQVGRSDREPGPVCLATLYDEVVAGLIDEGVEPAASLQRGALPEVWGDRLELGLLLRNLLGNALLYRGEAPLEVRVDGDAVGAGWRLSVADNGLGIPDESRELVFEMFRRLHGPREYPGSGLGLATCRKIVNRMKGRIWCRPNQGAGTVFEIEIPGGSDASG